MSKSNTPQRSPLGLLILFQLISEPMHVYRMQKLFEAEGKDRVVNVRSRASLYQTIERLVRHGLVEVAETISVEGYPDRTVYATTETGRVLAHEWLREMLASTEPDYPEFIAALSIVFALPPEEAQAELEKRAEKLEAALADTEAALGALNAGLPRLFVLEEEYRKAVLEAELSWVRGVVTDIREERLSWSEEWLREIAAAFLPDTEQDDPEDQR